MSDIAEDFLSWATDSARTLEERYGIVRLTESVYQQCYRGEDKQFPDWRETMKMHEQRFFNPAYQPRFDKDKLFITAGLLSQVTGLRLDNGGEDRPLRDLSFLRFLPDLTTFALRGFECETLEGLQYLPDLRELDLQTDEVENYNALAACRELRKISVRTQYAWPNIQVLAELPRLEEFYWNGNGFALADIPCLPALRSLHIESPSHRSDATNSLRNLHQLPEMPLLEHFWGGWFHRLDGIERYPRLRFLAIWGFFKSFSPTAALTAVTHLRVNSPLLDEVTTVAAMPSVRHFAVCSERPQDWGSLMASETLREVFHCGLDAEQSDLETLRMLIPTWDEIFSAPSPRPLHPLRLIVHPPYGPPGKIVTEFANFPDGPDGWDGHLGMRQSETWWVGIRLRTALRDAGLLKLQGVRFEAKSPDDYALFSTAPGSHIRRQLSITILKSEAIGRLPEIVQCLRAALAQIRHRWQIYFFVDPDPDAETWDESWKNPTQKSYAEEMEEVERAWEHKRQRKRIFLKDQHRMRLLRELGENPDSFEPTPLPVSPSDPDHDFSTAGDDQEEPDEEDKKDGGTAFFDPDDAKKDEVWLHPVEVGDPNRDWNDLHCCFILAEEGVYMNANVRGMEILAELLDVVPESM